MVFGLPVCVTLDRGRSCHKPRVMPKASTTRKFFYEEQVQRMEPDAKSCQARICSKYDQHLEVPELRNHRVLRCLVPDLVLGAFPFLVTG